LYTKFTIKGDYEHLLVEMNSACLLCALITTAGFISSWSGAAFVS